MHRDIVDPVVLRVTGRRLLCGLALPLLMLTCGMVAVPTFAKGTDRATNSAPAKLISMQRRTAPKAIKADEYLLIHDMPGVRGHAIEASTLLFVPKGKVPAGGWPVVAWVHGAATWSDKARAPSMSADLDGGLTRDGFISNYVFMIASLVDTGYAVVAPDLEGLGPVASEPAPYYNAASSARSVIAAVHAARQAKPSLSKRWAVVGHSDGGRGALAVESYVAEAADLDLKGIVALAPFTSIEASVRRFGDLARNNPAKADELVALQNFYVAGMATGLIAENASYDLVSVMGTDLQKLLPVIRMQGSPGAIATVTKTVTAKTPAGFRGFKADWSTEPAMAAFLAANDPAAIPSFRLRLPTLIAQGTDDGFVAEPLTAAFSAKLVAIGSPVTYRTYAATDHLSIVKAANSDVLAFLTRLLPTHRHWRGQSG